MCACVCARARVRFRGRRRPRAASLRTLRRAKGREPASRPGTKAVNLLRSSHRAGKVEQMSRALALVALMHLSSMPSEHPFMLDVASSPLTKLPCSPPRTIQAFGRLARKGGCKSSSASGSVGSTSARSRALASCLLWAWAAAERMLRQRNLDFLAPPCKRCWRRLAAQL